MSAGAERGPTSWEQSGGPGSRDEQGSAGDAVPESTPAVRRAALIVATLTSFATPFMGSSINIALPSIGRDFALDAVTLSWVPTAYLLSAAALLLPFGRLGDIAGRKRVFTAGVWLFTVTAALSAAAPSGAWLIAARALQGVSSAMVFGTGVAILMSVYPVGERGRALGISVAAVYAGLSVGPPVGGFLTQQLGWRSVFWGTIPLGVVVLGAVRRLEGEWAEARGERFDPAGSLCYSAAVVSLMLGLSWIPRASGVGLAGAGLAGLAAFVWRESRAESPILNVSLFRTNTVFAMSNLAALLNYSAIFAVGFLLSLYLQVVKGYSPQRAGLILVCQPILMALWSPGAGRLSDRIEPRLVASLGMGLITVALLALGRLGADSPVGYVVGSLIVLGTGMGLFSSPNTNAVMSSVERKFLGVASATLGTMRLTGQMLSMGLAMLIFSAVIGRAQITPAVQGPFVLAMRLAFYLFSVLCGVGIFASLSRGRVRGA
ncbi:MAG: MFS transporter [Candidatus Sumerlaeia bacterium]